MFSGGRAHLGAQQLAARPVGIDAQQARVLLRHAGAALAAEIDVADDDVLPRQVLERLADHGGVRLAEADAQHRAAAVVARLVGKRVHARDVAFVGCLVQQGARGIDVADEEHRQVGNLARVRVERRQSAFVERNAQRLQTQSLDIGNAAIGDQHLVDDEAFVTTDHFDTVLVRGEAGAFADVNLEVLFKLAPQRVQHIGIAQSGSRFARHKGRDFDAEARECLRHFHAYRTQTQHGHARRKRGLLEQAVGGQHPVAHGVPSGVETRARSGGDDDAARAVFLAVDRHPVGAEQSRAAADLVVRSRIRVLDGAGDKAVAQSPDAGQHGGQVHAQLLCAANAEGVEGLAAVKGVGRFDQQLGRHAAHARAGRAPGAVVDDEKAVRAFAHFAQR